MVAPEKIYYLSDCEKLISVATEMNLKFWKLENYAGSELQKYPPNVKYPEAIRKMFGYLNSEIIPDGKYKLIGKTGAKSTHRTEIVIQKGNDPAAIIHSTGNGNTQYSDYSSLIQENAKLKAEIYFLTEQNAVLLDQIAELRDEIESDEAESEPDTYKELVKEYAPQAFTLLQQLFVGKSLNPSINLSPSFADPAPAAPPAAPKQIIRFSPEYIAFWKNCTDQEAVQNEYYYLENNRPDKLKAFTALFNG